MNFIIFFMVLIAIILIALYITFRLIGCERLQARKPVEVPPNGKHKYEYYICPTCRHLVGCDDIILNFCPYCGQKIDREGDSWKKKNRLKQ